MANTNSIQQSLDQCPECQSNLVTNLETICTNCGLVVDDSPIDRGPDWDNFEDSENSPRAKPADNPQLHDGGLGSTISWDRTGNQMHPRRREQHSRAKFQGKTERIRGQGLRDINTLCSVLDLPGCISDRACSIWQGYHRDNGILGETREGYTSAAVLVACREQNLPITVVDVVENSNVPDSRMVYRAVQKLASELEIDALAPKPLRFVPRLCSELGLSKHIRPEAERQCRLAQAKNIHVGRKPFAVAGTAVYLVSDATQVDIGNAAQCTPATLRNIRDDWPNGQAELSAF